MITCTLVHHHISIICHEFGIQYLYHCCFLAEGLHRLSVHPAGYATGALGQRCSLGQGKYIFKLLAIDVPTAEGPEQRVYLAGNDAIYNRGAGDFELQSYTPS